MKLRWRRDREFHEEIDAHLDLEIQANLDRGLSPEQARFAALRRFGNRAHLMETVREADPLFTVETFVRDVLYGLRNLRRHPGFAVAATVSLALGIGANTLIFSVLDSTLLKPLALPDPDRLVVVWNLPDRSQPDRVFTSSISRYRAIQDRSRSFESVGAFNGAACGVRNLGFEEDGAPAERIFGQTASPSLLHALGVKPLIGRLFTEAEDQVDDVAPVVLISHRTWQRRFGGDPDIVGQTMTMNRVATTVIGVLPADFDFFGDGVEFLAPLCLTRAQVESRVGGNTVVGRLKAGVPLAQVQAEVDTIVAQLAASDPERHKGLGARVEPLQRAQARLPSLAGSTRDYGLSLLILQGAVAFVLLIACANVAGLLLARTASRRTEIALRLALGAGRWRVVRQLMTESLPVGILGGVLGVFLSWGGLALFVAAAPPDFPRLAHISLDVRVLAFTALVVVVTSVLFAAVPAIQAATVNLADPLKESTRSVGDSRQRVRRLLVTGQIALALVLLVGAGLMIRSFVRVVTQDLGGDTANLLAFDFRMPLGETVKPLVERYKGSSLWDVGPGPAQTFERVLERLQAVPGVVSAAAVNVAPYGSQSMDMPFWVEGRPRPASQGLPQEGRRDAQPSAHYFAVTRGYFATMRIPLLQGRDFTDHDTADRPLVLIVNQTMARQFFPGEDPIGKRVQLDFVPDERPREIVGVVRDASVGPLQSQQSAAIYVPHVQQTPLFAGPFVYMRIGMYFVLRTSGDPLQVVPSMKRAVAEVDRFTPVADVKTVEQSLDGQVRHLRLYMLLLGMFGAVALILAATGIYGVMAYSVAQRTREIGIRMALGARARQVLIMILRQGTRVIGTGLVLGLAGAVVLARVIQSVLFEVTATDPPTYAAVALLLLLIATLACLIPARRAAAVDPAITLKHE